MKILFVSATMPPEGTATANIIGNIMKEMRNRGEEVSGLTFKNSITDANNSFWEGIKIYHADYVREYGYRNQSVLDTLFKLKRKVYDAAYARRKRPYRELAVKMLVGALENMHANSNFDMIIAVAAFYDAVEAVRRYHDNKEGSNTKYIFYQLDPLSENLAFNTVDSQWLEKYEMEIFSQADHVFTTKKIYELKECKRWNLKNVTAIDFPCVDMSLALRTGSQPKNEEEIRLVYAGLLNEEVRDATVALKICSRIKNPYVSFYFLGKGQEELLQEYANGELAGKLHIIGNLSAKACEEWLLSADFLLIIGNNVENQVPSKVFSCMSYGLPIIGTCKSQKCPSIAYLQRISNALVIEESQNDERIDCLVKQIEDFIEKYKKTKLSYEQIKEYAWEYTPEYITEMFISVFQTL